MCEGTRFEQVINIGDNPLVNSLIDEKDLDKKEPVFPLIVEQCQKCFLVQVRDIISADEIYKNVDYLYFSSDMPGLSDYFEEYAKDLAQRFLNVNDFVVEIGSNDGLMLKHIERQELVHVLGVDPASNVVVRALQNNIPTVSDFFTHRLAKSIKRENGDAKLIYGNNCIAHLDGLIDLMKGVDELLADDGVFVVECNYWGAMVENTNYSLIYHDHFSYFGVQQWVDFAPRFGLKVFDATVTPAQDGSLRIFMSRDKYEPTERFEEILDNEMQSNLHSLETGAAYRSSVFDEAHKLRDLIHKLKEEGKAIAGYGAAAKGFSVLKVAQVTDEHIDYFVDDSPAKQNKYTPVTHIPIYSRKDVEDKLPDYFLITAPNYEKIIVKKEAEFLKNGGHFITVDSRII